MSVSLYGSGNTVIQVVSSSFNTQFTSSSTSQVDVTGWTATITPQSTTSKILVMFNGVGSATNSLNLYIVRNGTTIDIGTGGSTENATVPTVLSANNTFLYCLVGSYLDSPSSTSALTYKIQANTDAGTFAINKRGSDTFAGGTSTITLMEISGS